MYQIDGILELLQTKGFGTIGVNVFSYHAPASVENCAIVFPSNDPPVIDPDTPGYYTGKFQIILRNNDYQSGIDLANQISKQMTVYNTTVSTMFIRYLRPLYQVRVFRRADSGLVEFSISFEIKFISNM